MRKQDEISRTDSCIGHAHPKEMVFVLLSRDAAAPFAIRAWCDERVRLGKNVETDAQIVEARACADTMEREGRKWGTGEPDDPPPTVALADLVPELQRLFEGYLEAEPDGDKDTFASWVADEIRTLEHTITCECDCHANNAVWPGKHCKNCGGTCEPGEG